MGLGRPTNLRPNAHVDDCLAVLDNGDHDASDMVFCQLVRLQRIADEFVLQVTPDGLATSTSLKVRNAYKDLEKKLQAWEKQNGDISNHCRSHSVFGHACIHVTS